VATAPTSVTPPAVEKAPVTTQEDEDDIDDFWGKYFGGR
jgi:hypothetical protein